MPLLCAALATCTVVWWPPGYNYATRDWHTLHALKSLLRFFLSYFNFLMRIKGPNFSNDTQLLEGVQSNYT